MKALYIVCALIGSVAAATSVIVTETPGPSILHAADGSTKALKTHAECVKLASTLFSGTIASEKSTCSDVTNILVEGVCDPLPSNESIANNAATDGVAQPCPGDDTRWYTQNTGYARRPFPTCQVITLVPESADPLPAECKQPAASPVYSIPPEDALPPPVVSP